MNDARHLCTHEVDVSTFVRDGDYRVKTARSSYSPRSIESCESRLGPVSDSEFKSTCEFVSDASLFLSVSNLVSSPCPITCTSTPDKDSSRGVCITLLDSKSMLLLFLSLLKPGRTHSNVKRESSSPANLEVQRGFSTSGVASQERKRMAQEKPRSFDLWSRNLKSTRTFSNNLSRFVEACVSTIRYLRVSDEPLTRNARFNWTL